MKKMQINHSCGVTTVECQKITGTKLFLVSVRSPDGYVFNEALSPYYKLRQIFVETKDMSKADKKKISSLGFIPNNMFGKDVVVLFVKESFVESLLRYLYVTSNQLPYPYVHVDKNEEVVEWLMKVDVIDIVKNEGFEAVFKQFPDNEIGHLVLERWLSSNLPSMAFDFVDENVVSMILARMANLPICFPKIEPPNMNSFSVELFRQQFNLGDEYHKTKDVLYEKYSFLYN